MNKLRGRNKRIDDDLLVKKRREDLER